MTKVLELDLAAGMKAGSTGLRMSVYSRFISSA